MRAISAIGGGFAGACAVTLIHETVRKVIPRAPRLDLLGMEAARSGIQKAGWHNPSSAKLYSVAMVGDIIGNSLFYSLAGIGKEKNSWKKGLALGLAAGIGAVMLPEKIGLNEKHTNRTTGTQIMTIGLYVTGALLTTAVMKIIERRELVFH